MENNTIQRALKALYDDVDRHDLTINVANALKKLIETLGVYYSNKYDEIENSLDYESIMHRMSVLSSQMTDYIVSINDTLKGKNDVFCIASMIYKEINYDDKKGVFKRKRLI